MGVSGVSLRVPRSTRSVTARGYVFSPPSPANRRNISSVSWNVLASGTVGPDPMTLRSSPTTSEIAKVRQAQDVCRANGGSVHRFDMTVRELFMDQPVAEQNAS